MAKQRRPGWWYPYIFVGMFMVVVAVNATLAFFATSTFSGLQTEQAYDKGLKYNDTLRASEAQKALGWTVTINVEGTMPTAQGGRQSDVVATFADAKGQPIRDLEVMVEIDRPTQAGFQKELALVEKAPGRYLAPVTVPLQGQWELRMAARKAETEYHVAQRVMLP